MQSTGELISISRDYRTDKPLITFALEEYTYDSLNGLDGLLDITAEKHRDKRSLTANGLLWVCLQKIAVALHTDKWTLYLQMLKRYGEFTPVRIRKEAVPMMMRQWRECEVVGELEKDGKTYVDLLCYYGSSTYDSKQFSTLLDGVIDEMKEAGLEPPTSKEMTRVLKQLEKG